MYQEDDVLLLSLQFISKWGVVLIGNLSIIEEKIKKQANDSKEQHMLSIVAENILDSTKKALITNLSGKEIKQTMRLPARARPKCSWKKGRNQWSCHS